MGLDYSFNLITERQAVDALLREVAASVVATDRDRLHACMPSTPETALRDLRRDEFERGSDICLSFLVEPSPEVLKYDATLGAEPVNGSVPIGCVWTSLLIGKRFAYLRAVAATSDMSRLFAESNAVQGVISRMASNAGCYAAYLDDETERYHFIWPTRRTFEWADDIDYHLEDSVDTFCNAVLSAAGLPDGGSATGT
jgi:hypothetical protein